VKRLASIKYAPFLQNKERIKIYATPSKGLWPPIINVVDITIHLVPPNFVTAKSILSQVTLHDVDFPRAVW
jgi:hypothetical protein